VRSEMKKEGNEVYDISIHDVRKMMNNGRRLVLLDIREKQELETGYIRGAVFIPYDQVEKK